MNRTTHYNLVLFESTDKPTWLENWNSTMSHIDEVLYRISSGGGDLPDLSEVVARLEVLESQMSSANLQIQQNANNITAMQGSIDTINTTLVGLAETDSALQSNITSLQDSVSNIQTSLGTISDQLSNVQSSVSSLDTRLTALENAGTSNQKQIYALYKTEKITEPTTILNLKKDDIIVISNGVSDNGVIPLIQDTLPLVSSNNYDGMPIIEDDNFVLCQKSLNWEYRSYNVRYVETDKSSLLIPLVNPNDVYNIMIYRKCDLPLIKLNNGTQITGHHPSEYKGKFISFSSNGFSAPMMTISDKIFSQVAGCTSANELLVSFSGFMGTAYTTAYPSTVNGIMIHPEFTENIVSTFSNKAYLMGNVV